MHQKNEDVENKMNPYDDYLKALQDTCNLLELAALNAKLCAEYTDEVCEHLDEALRLLEEADVF
uniref:Uncharacterized protein n=1 Tax=viral metagenome TaxID=1070528 RepID=A0A6M3LEX3_9ZZZZ